MLIYRSKSNGISDFKDILRDSLDRFAFILKLLFTDIGGVWNVRYIACYQSLGDRFAASSRFSLSTLSL